LSNIVIGVDPGTEKSAFATFNGKDVLAFGIVENNALRHHAMWEHQNVFCEMIASYGMAVGASTFETVYWIGRFVELAAISGGNVTRVFRKDIKLHLCNSPRAKDANVRQALIDRIGPQGTKKNQGPTYGIKSHEWAALAVAVYGWDTIFGRLANGKPPA
jgi:hypothetical protein